MKALLPIGGDLGSLPWCSADTDPNNGEVTWQWRSAASNNSITVDVMNTVDDTNSRVMVTAEHSTGYENRAGCR
jgi:hypothetical protein